MGKDWLIGAIIGFLAGAAITYYAVNRFRTAQSLAKQTAENTELYDMWKENGHIKVEVHRKVKVK